MSRSEAAVESVAERIKVVLKMFFHGSILCAENKRLCVEYKDVTPSKGFTVGYAISVKNYDWYVIMTDMLGDVECWQPLGFGNLVVGNGFQARS